MFSLVLFLLLSTVTLATSVDDNLNTYWQTWKTHYRKVYNLKEVDYLRRIIWETNLRYINLHNLEYSLGQHSYNLSMNRFGDMTNQEFLSKMTGKLNSNHTQSGIKFMAPLNVNDLPPTVDWRDKGYVTPIKDQGQCGSCWAFSATGALEGQHFHKTGKLVSLSEQNLVDCSTSYGNEGCNGGEMYEAFNYIKDNKGIDTEEAYPYEAQDGNCRFKTKNVGATCTGYVSIAKGHEDELKKAVATVGPISVAIDASKLSFQFYKHDVYDEKSCSRTQLDHGVLAVGYGTYQGNDYWLVKNSWGTDWGLQGYIMMSRNKKNQCGIATEATYPTV